MTKKTTIMVRNEQHSTNYMKQQPGASSRHDARHDSRHEHATNTARSPHHRGTIGKDHGTIAVRLVSYMFVALTLMNVPSQTNSQKSSLIYRYSLLFVRYMQEKPYVDKDKLAIWGWVSESA